MRARLLNHGLWATSATARLAPFRSHAIHSGFMIVAFWPKDHNAHLHRMAIKLMNYSPSSDDTLAIQRSSNSRFVHTINHQHFNHSPPLPPSSRMPEALTWAPTPQIRVCIHAEMPMPRTQEVICFQYTTSDTMLLVSGVPFYAFPRSNAQTGRHRRQHFQMPSLA